MTTTITWTHEETGMTYEMTAEGITTARNAIGTPEDHERLPDLTCDSYADAEELAAEGNPRRREYDEESYDRCRAYHVS